MAVADGFDLEQLLAPIAGDDPCGADPRLDIAPTAPYQRIRDARASAGVAEREEARGESREKRPPSAEYWRQIRDMAPILLSTQAKDLEIACFYLEALLRAGGFAGLRQGFALCLGLVDRFWDGLHPRPDEDGLETRLGPLTSLNGADREGTLIEPIRKVAVTSAGPPGGFGFWQVIQAESLAGLSPDKREARIAAGSPTEAEIAAAVAETPAAFFATLVGDLEGCIAEYGRLTEALALRCGRDAPPSSNIAGVLQDILDKVTYRAGDKLKPAEAPAAQAAGAPSSGGAAAGAADAPRQGSVATREDAFRLILQAADYFKRMEPHSPLALTLQEAVRRGRLPLPDLLRELVRDNSARRDFLMAAGIQPPDD
jgi:type VI secretion system protein ImpA